MIVTEKDIKQIYTKEDIEELKFDIEMMKLALHAFTSDDFITYSNYKKVYKEYTA